MTKRSTGIAACCMLLSLALVPTAEADFVPGVTAKQAAIAMWRSTSLLKDATAYTAQGAANQVITSTTALTGLPTSGSSFTMMSTGDALQAAQTQSNTASSSWGTTDVDRGNSAHDIVTLKVVFTAPSGSDCLHLKSRFLTEEIPYVESAGSADAINVNDAFIVELDQTTWTVNNSSISAPRNIVRDHNGRLVQVRSAWSSTGSLYTQQQAAGTVYAGATPLLKTTVDITPGSHTLYLSLFDQYDDTGDSAVFIDDLRVGSRVQGKGCLDKASTKTTLNLDKTRSAYRASGAVTPNHRGQRVRVTLYKARGGRFVEKVSKSARLSRRSRYTVAFDDLGSGSCKLKTTFRGDDHHRGSSRAQIFTC